MTRKMSIMSDNDLKKVVVRVARQTRRWAMRNRHGKFFDDLNGMCAIASMRLFDNLSRNGVPCEIGLNNRDGDGHCFVIVDDHAVDVTATQFGCPPIFIEPIKAAKKIKPRGVMTSPWHYTKKLETSTALRNELSETGWPFEQIQL